MTKPESTRLNLNLSPIVFVRLPVEMLRKLLFEFAPEAGWVITSGTGEFSAFGWDHPSGPGDEAIVVEHLASRGIDEAVALWPDHWDEGWVLVEYKFGKRVSEEEVYSPLDVAAERGIFIIA